MCENQWKFQHKDKITETSVLLPLKQEGSGLFGTYIFLQLDQCCFHACGE